MIAERIYTQKGLNYPLWVTPKVNGLPCVIHGGEPRKNLIRPIANQHVRAILGELPSFEGVLVVGGPFDHDVYKKTLRMADNPLSQDEFTYWVQDVRVRAEMTLTERLDLAVGWAGTASSCVKPAPYQLIHNEVDLILYEEKYLALNALGIIIREISPESHKELIRKDETKSSQIAGGIASGKAKRRARRVKPPVRKRNVRPAKHLRRPK